MRDVEGDVGALTRLDLFQLREAWRDRFGPPPPFRSVDLFRLMLAWRLQAAVHGGLDAVTKKALRSSGAIVAEGQELGVGAVIRRQWQGREVSVQVVEDGFSYEGRTYRSLSAVASAVAGTRWNGPKFFGLRP
jgi:hypothetical protein